MANLPQTWRFPRAHLQGDIPTVLRFSNGQRIGANLQVISLTGGLLSLSQPVVQGSQVKLMFLTGAGSVLGGAEMLSPVASGLQPFRFVSLAADDHRRLGALIQQRSGQEESELAWMEKLRAASAQHSQPRRWPRTVAGVVGACMIGLATAAYLLHFGLLK
ncbi:MAG: hypothetical protein ABSD75_02450 [Terriglobales bacterium]|jgi:hypothetical protein